MSENIQLSEGQPAPEIEAQVTDDGPFRLSDFRGKWVVVYFFVRSNTPG